MLIIMADLDDAAYILAWVWSAACVWFCVLHGFLDDDEQWGAIRAKSSTDSTLSLSVPIQILYVTNQLIKVKVLLGYIPN